MTERVPEASWIRDEGEWRVLVPPHLAKIGARVVVERADGTHRRTVTIKAVSARSFGGRIVCEVHKETGR